MGLGGSAHCVAGGRDRRSQSPLQCWILNSPPCVMFRDERLKSASDLYGFATDIALAGPARYADVGHFPGAADRASARDSVHQAARGEPLVHPEIVRLSVVYDGCRRTQGENEA
jgi:hypothetical protein